MTQVMNPSQTTPMTNAQMGKFGDLLIVGLRKLGLPSDASQQVIETQTAEVSNELAAVVAKRVATLTGMIVRRVKPDRSRTPQAMLDATGRKQYTSQAVVDAMPRGEGEEVDVFFFKPRPEEYDHDGWMSDEALDRALDIRGLKSDPYAQSAVNEADPAFADEHPNGTHWKDAQGKWCFAAFDRWRGGRDVSVDRGDDDWSDDWFFAGVRK